eukprot:4897165-Pyramimonas_sp.AAC.1
MSLECSGKLEEFYPVEFAMSLEYSGCSGSLDWSALGVIVGARFVASQSCLDKLAMSLECSRKLEGMGDGT